MRPQSFLKKWPPETSKFLKSFLFSPKYWGKVEKRRKIAKNARKTWKSFLKVCYFHQKWGKSRNTFRCIFHTHFTQWTFFGGHEFFLWYLRFFFPNGHFWGAMKFFSEFFSFYWGLRNKTRIFGILNILFFLTSSKPGNRNTDLARNYGDIIIFSSCPFSTPRALLVLQFYSMFGNIVHVMKSLMI